MVYQKEAVLPFDQIHGMRYSDNAKKIIKLKEETPKTGTKTDFIGRDNIPFSIMTKTNNWDIVCPEYTSYLAIKTMIDTILSQPKPKILLKWHKLLLLIMEIMLTPKKKKLLKNIMNKKIKIIKYLLESENI